MAKPSPDSARPRLLALELWGLGDLALALPFIRAAAQNYEVTLLAKPHAAPLLQHFAPEVRHAALVVPWTAFTGKYRLFHWPWTALRRQYAELRTVRFDVAASARPDPRDHLLLRLSGARRSVGFGCFGSGVFLTDNLARPARPHRAAYWSSLAQVLGCNIAPPALPKPGRRILLHAGAGHPVRQWPRTRFEELAARLRQDHWDVTLIDDSLNDLDGLLVTLGQCDRFIGNDSGPGHIAALLGVPTFTIFGPQLPELFAPQHPKAEWIQGAPCPYKPCFDACRFPSPHCIDLSIEQVWPRIQAWLNR